MAPYMLYIANTGTRIAVIACMKEELLMNLPRLATLCCIGVLACATAAQADTLHGFCWGTSTCADDGTNTPVSANPPDFGFEDSGNGTVSGDLRIVFLVPTSADPNPSLLSITVDNTSAFSDTSAMLDSTTPWSTGTLANYLGFSASPNNPIGAFTGGSFDVYVDNLGIQTLGSTGGGAAGPDLTLTSGIPEGSYITAFLNDDGSISATANSGAILLDGTPMAMTPEPSSLLLLGTGILAAATLLRRRALQA